MFLHNFKYTLKILFKKKSLIFWTIIWPLIMATMFNVAFSKLADGEKLDTINIGIIDNEYYQSNEALNTTLTELGDSSNEDYLFNITYGTEDDLNKLLNDKKIDGYIKESQDDTSVIVKESGINQTIVKNVIDQVNEYQELVTNVMEDNMSKINVGEIYVNVMDKVSSNREYLNDDSPLKVDYTVIEFYTLIAMTCLYGSMVTCEVIKNYLANINKNGARVTLAPVSRFSLVVGGLIASGIVQLIAMSLLLFYTKDILHIDYGNQFGLVIILSICGSLAGSTAGLLIGSLSFKNENIKNGVLLAATMFGCFLSGMMGISMKYIVDKNIPILNKLNPAAIITDGFYAIYSNMMNRFWFDIASLLIFSFVLILITISILRRKKYDSI